MRADRGENERQIVCYRGISLWLFSDLAEEASSRSLISRGYRLRALKIDYGKPLINGSACKVGG